MCLKRYSQLKKKKIKSSKQILMNEWVKPEENVKYKKIHVSAFYNLKRSE